MGYVFLLAALILNAAANLLMKAGANRLTAAGESISVQAVLTNYYLLVGLMLFALNVIFYVAALTRLNLSVAYPVMTAGGLLVIVTASVLLYREALTVAQVIGVLILAVGIVLVTFKGAA